MVNLAAGRVEEAARHARRPGRRPARSGPGEARRKPADLAGDIASAGSAEGAEGFYHEALALGEPRGMRPLIAHCHLGPGALRRRAGEHEHARDHLTTAAAMYRDMGMSFWLAKAEAALEALR